MFRVFVLGLVVVGLTSCDQPHDPPTSDVLGQLTTIDNPWYAAGVEQRVLNRFLVCLINLICVTKATVLPNRL